MITTPTLHQLQRGLKIAEQISALEAEMAAIFNGSAPVSKEIPAQSDGRKSKRSAATIARMKASQQARWAKLKTPATAAKSPVKKGGISAEGRARIVAAQKARWAKIKGQKAPAASKAPAKAKAEPSTNKKRKPMSAEVKAKLGAAMKARWASAKAGKGPAPTASK